MNLSTYQYPPELFSLLVDTDFSRCWENDVMKAKGLVSLKAKRLVSEVRSGEGFAVDQEGLGVGALEGHGARHQVLDRVGDLWDGSLM